jgi:exonuclease-1
MIEIFLNLLKEREIQFVVAPFEADAQLAYLAREKFVKGVVTEDSDLLVFGCPLVIFKLDPEGKCDKVLGDDLFLKKSSPFFNMNLDKMRQICILSGCDYLPNIPSLGLKTSHKLFSELQNLQAVREFLESKDKYRIPPSYWTDFNMANETFLYQKIYCPTGKMLKNLNLLEAGVECIEYLRLEETVEEIERFNKIIRGECCPKTMVPYNFMPGPTPTIIQPKDNSLLRVTTPSLTGPKQTLLNQFTKIGNRNTNVMRLFNRVLNFRLI